jgi:hypothetical protein
VKVQQGNIRSGSTVCFDAFLARGSRQYLGYTLFVGNNRSDALPKYGCAAILKTRTSELFRRFVTKSPGKTAA